MYHAPLVYPAQHSVGASMPGSRAGSPPIVLTPLKSLASPSGGSGGAADERMRVDDTRAVSKLEEGGADALTSPQTTTASAPRAKIELPHFSEFEAAARGLPLLASAV